MRQARAVAGRSPSSAPPSSPAACASCVSSAVRLPRRPSQRCEGGLGHVVAGVTGGARGNGRRRAPRSPAVARARTLAVLAHPRTTASQHSRAVTTAKICRWGTASMTQRERVRRGCGRGGATPARRRGGVGRGMAGEGSSGGGADDRPVAVVTGAAGVLGRAAAAALVDGGYRVAVRRRRKRGPARSGGGGGWDGGRVEMARASVGPRMRVSLRHMLRG